MTGWVAAVMVISLAAVFAVVYANTRSGLRGQIDRDLTGDSAQLVTALRGLPPSVRPQAAAAVAARYVHAQSYSATSTVLFVLIPGVAVVSNHPELFGARAPEDGETAADQARENAAGRQLLAPHPGFSQQPVPDVGRVRLLERTVALAGRRAVVGAGEPLALVERAEHGVAAAFGVAAAVAFVLALLASYLAGARVSAPLRRMAAVASRVDGGDLAPRMEISPAQRGEVRVLGESFNHMLDRLAEAFASQREFIADASHELRTPLTVIRGQLEVLAAQHSPSGEEVKRVERRVREEITRVTRLVEDLLLLARAEHVDFLRRQRIELAPFVHELWDGLSLTARRRFELGPLPEGQLSADPDRLAQALRNLAGNAIAHTVDGEGLVRLEVERIGHGQIRFSVLDDGPGIPAAERDRIFERFHRTDPGRARSDGGAGLGLAIVRAIAEAHGGAVSADGAGRVAGARLDLVLPGFTPA